MSTERRLLPRDSLKTPLSGRHSAQSIPSAVESATNTNLSQVISIFGHELIDFSSNDYMGLAREACLMEGAVESMKLWGMSATGSRLMSGDLQLHHTLEAELAQFKGTEAALLFGTGYLANIGAITALINRNDVIIADKLVHASIIDGILLSKAKYHRFRHNDTEHLQELLSIHATGGKTVWIVAETLYSMDGDIAPVQALITLKKHYNAHLFLDEAHAIGVFGENSEGIVSQKAAPNVDVLIGTFGKAFGSFGAFAACSNSVKHQLINHARSFIFSTALPPAIVGANLTALRLIPRLTERRKRLKENMTLLATLLKRELGIMAHGQSQIVPIIIGENQRCLQVAQDLMKYGFYVKAIRPPTVPKGSARLRISLTALHTNQDIHELVKALKDVL